MRIALCVPLTMKKLRFCCYCFHFFLLGLFYFMFMNGLPACMYVHYVHAWCPWRSEKCIGYPWIFCSPGWLKVSNPPASLSHTQFWGYRHEPPCLCKVSFLGVSTAVLAPHASFQTSSPSPHVLGSCFWSVVPLGHSRLQLWFARCLS